MSINKRIIETLTKADQPLTHRQIADLLYTPTERRKFKNPYFGYSDTIRSHLAQLVKAGRIQEQVIDSCGHTAYTVMEVK